MQSTERRSPGPASRRCFIQSSSPRRSRPPGRLHQGAMGSCLCRRGPQGPACPSAIHWTPEAFVLECHELVGFHQSLAVYSRTRPGCAYRDRRRTELSSCQQPLLVSVACRHRAWGELSEKSVLLRQMLPCAASRASLRASARAVVFTQCAATNTVHIALVMAPIGLPLGAPK
jgi:hypothetical protein